MRELKTLGILVVLFLLISVAQAEDWPMFQHDASHTGYSGSKLPDTLDLIWVSEDYNIDFQPIIYGGKVFGCNMLGEVYCLDENTGELIWHVKVGDGEIPFFWTLYSPISVMDGKVFVSVFEEERHKIYCLEENNGKLIWEYESDMDLAGVTVRDGKLYAGCFCLNASTGKLIWENSVVKAEVVQPYTSVTLNSPAIGNGKVFISTQSLGQSGKIYCLEENTGKLIWSYEGDCDSFSLPSFSDNKVFVSSFGMIRPCSLKIYCLNGSDGKVIWDYDCHRYILGPPAITDGCILAIPTYEKRVVVFAYCLDKNTGSGVHPC